MGIFDWLKKKSEKAPAVNPDPEIGESEGHWNESESISLSMSKDSVLEVYFQRIHHKRDVAY